MVLEIIGAALLLAFGLFAIYFSIEEAPSDTRLWIVMLLGILAIGLGSWIIITKLTLAFILKKIAGLVLGAVGLFLLIGFPDIADYQYSGMSKAGIFIGLVLLIIGAYLVFF